MKICSKCKTNKPSDEFYDGCKDTPDGKQRWCKLCMKASAKNRYDSDPEKFRKNTREYYVRNRNKVLAYGERYFQEHREYFKEKCKESWHKHKIKRSESRSTKRQGDPEWKKKEDARIKKWRSKNKHRVIAWVAKREATKLNATPKWADIEKIVSIYKKAQELTISKNIKHHVDHDVPLCGKNVCGLHVENNLQILTATENVRKYNIWIS